MSPEQHHQAFVDAGACPACARVQALITKHQAEAHALMLEGIASRRMVVREALHAEALRIRAFAGDLQDALDGHRGQVA